jgi:K+-sensing histidine kinase KdpD
MPDKQALRPKLESKKINRDVQAEVTKLRALAHDLSNALEAIIQASYLLTQAKLDSESKRWAQLLQTSSDEAAKINREIRRLLRSMSAE